MDSQATYEQLSIHGNSKDAGAIEKETATETQAIEKSTEYVFDRVIGGTKVRNKRHYRVRWYLYTSKDEKIDPAKNNPQHFITRYRNLQNKKATK